MSPQTGKSWRDYRLLNQNWSYQPTLAGLGAVSQCIIDSGTCYLKYQINANDDYVDGR